MNEDILDDLLLAFNVDTPDDRHEFAPQWDHDKNKCITRCIRCHLPLSNWDEKSHCTTKPPETVKAPITDTITLNIKEVIERLEGWLDKVDESIDDLRNIEHLIKDGDHNAGLLLILNELRSVRRNVDESYSHRITRCGDRLKALLMEINNSNEGDKE